MGKRKEKPIKVYVRIRPLNKKEIQRKEESAVEAFHDEVETVKLIDHKSSHETSYRFDRVFGTMDSNKTVFHFTTRDCLIKLLNGTNCSLIAYGETGSGKTYTLMETGGVTDYTISYLFKLMGADQMHSYKVSCSFVQVYVEKLYDILSINTKRELTVREHPSKGVYVQGLSEHIVSKEEHVFNLFTKGKGELIKARTEMHHFSSRSHSIFQITIQRTLCTSKEKFKEDEYYHKLNRVKIPQGLNVLPKEMVVCGKLDICDLAGSERLGKTLLDSVNQNEARYINSSLLQLGNVICALAEKKHRHVPFRNSTLTRLLQECLGSQCLTSFIICVSPSSNEIHETRCSLNFGSRARTITHRFRYFRRAINHELLTKNLSTKIRLLEKQLLITTTAPLVCSDSHAQTEVEESELIGNTNLCISMVKHTLELSDVFDKCNHSLYKNTCRNENGQVVCSEGRNTRSKQCTKLKLIVTFATKRISDIVMKLQDELRTGSLHDTDTLRQCTNTLGTVENSSNTEKVLNESICTLSELCFRIRNDIEAIVRSMHNVPKVMQSEDPIETHAWYIHLNQFLNELENKEFISFHFSCHLVYLVQLVQIVRLSFACSSRKYKSQKMKPIICSTSIEDGMISSSTPNTTLEYYEKSTVINIENTERATGVKKYFRRRNRKSENNMRKQFSSLHFSSPSIDTDGREGSSSYRQPVTCYPKFTYGEGNLSEIEEARKDEPSKEYIPSAYTNVVSKYNELHQKYVEAVEESHELFMTLGFLEQEHDDNIQQPTFEEDTKMYYATSKEKKEELTQMEKESSRYKLMVHNSDETLRKLSNKITILESRIDAQNKIMTKLEFEKNELMKRREENIEKNKKMQDIMKDLKSFQDLFESRISLSEQILHLSEVVDDKVRQNKGKFKDITELEQEVFDLLECNVQYEKALEDIRKEMTDYAHNIRDIEYKIRDHVIHWNDDDAKEDSTLTNNATILPNECDFKLSDLVTSDDHVMQNIIVGDLHKSAEKNSSIIKDLKTCQLIKELLREKLRLIEKIERMQDTLKKLQENIVRNKCKIDVFVKQLGQLDLQLSGVQQQWKQKRDNSADCTASIFSEEDVELVEVSEMSYDNFNIFMQYFSNGEAGKKATDKGQKTNENFQLIVDEELEELKSEVNYYKGKCKEMKSQSNELSDCLRVDLESTNESLLCKIDYLKHTNTIIEKEIKWAKKKSIDQKNEMKILKDETKKNAEQVKNSKFQSTQIEAKNEITRLQLEKSLSKYKAKNIYLEKCVKDLLDEEDEETESERNYFNDSGLPPEDLSDS